MKKDALVEAHEFIATLRTHTEFVVDTVAALERLKNAIALLSEYADFRVVFEPGIEPRLVDYLAITIPRALEGAIYGTLAGLLLGVIANAPRQGAALGAGFGAVLGTAHGLEAVEQGWRAQVHYLPNGTLHIRQL